MANKRIKDLGTTATSLASDDFVAVDGSSQGTRKIQKANLVNDISSEIAGTYLDEANNLSDVASKDTSKLNLEVPDVGTAPNEVPMSGQLGTMAFQDASGVSVGQLEVTDKAGIGTSNPSTKCHIVGNNADQLKLDNAGEQWTQLNLANNGTTKTFVALDHTDHKFIIGANGSYSDLNYIGLRPDGTNDDLVVTRDGLVGIGTTSPGSYDADADDLVVGNSSTPTNSGATIATVGGGVGSIYFADGTAAPARYAGYVVYNHGSNSLIFGSNATTRWTINSSGHLVSSGGRIDIPTGGGIYFNNSNDAAGATSEILDDYEVGTWSPVYTPASGSFTAITMNVSNARYVKVGKQVTVMAYILTDNLNTTGGSGNLKITGLPYANESPGWTAVSVGYASNWGTNHPAGGYVHQGASEIYLTERKTGIGGALTEMTVGNLNSTSSANYNSLMFFASYTTA